MADGEDQGPGGSPLAFAPPGSPQRGDADAVGLSLDGRYRLLSRRTRDGSSSTWDGRDDQLRRPVGIRVVAGATAEDAVDAARRAAALDDPRLSRVLDVGRSQAADGSALGWVITEQPAGRPLADLLHESPMAATRVRALVGEAAAVLTRASAAGLHHRRLDPASVVVTGNGAVTVLGLEVAAAAAGLPPVSSARAEREDAVALVCLLYAGLTGLWPHGPCASLGGAPTAGGVAVPPAELVTGVPNDLDTLAAVTLGPYDDGPRSPAELVQELAPWGSAVGPVTAPVRTARRTAAGPATTAAWAPPPDRAPQVGPTAQAGRAAAEAAPTPADGPDAFDALVGPAAGSGAAPLRRAGRPGPVDEPGPVPLRRGAGRLVLALVALVVTGLLVLALANLSSVRGTLGLAPSAGAPAPVATGTPGTPSATPSTGQAPPAPAAGAPRAVTAVRALDPQGDGTEGDARAGRAVDGDPASAWSSDTYRTAAFGNLKSGVGLALDLGSPAGVSEVDLTVAGTGGAVEVRSSADGAYAGSAVLATAQVGSGSGDPVAVHLPQPVTTRWVVLWFTTLPRAPEGFRVDLSEVTVR